MSEPLFIDTETLGLNGPIVLLQMAIGDDEVALVDLWRNPLQGICDLLEYIINHPGGIVGFNLAFDCFQITKMWNLVNELIPVFGTSACLYNIIEGNEQAFLDAEERAIDGKCLKPVHILDLMLHAQKGEYQKCLGNDGKKANNRNQEIRIFRVPVSVSHALRDKLEAEVVIPDIMFKGKRGKQTHRWNVITPAINPFTKEEIPGFSDLLCNMVPSSSLKNIVLDLGIAKDVATFSDVGIPKELYPIEIQFAPYGNALWNIEEDQLGPLLKSWTRREGVQHREKLNLPFRGTWVHFAKRHVEFWKENQEARVYAENDIIYTRGLYEHFDKPPMDDPDSLLAACVANVRYKGYAVDLKTIQAQCDEARKVISRFPEHAKPTACARYIRGGMTEQEKLTALKGTSKEVLEELVLTLGGEAGKRATLISTVRKAAKKKQLLDKFLIAKRFFASFRVIGTKSTRMSGADDLNAQGINHAPEVRRLFPLAFPDEELGGGDFDAFEVGIFQAITGDEDLKKQLESGMSIHGLFGAEMYEMPYDEIRASTEKYGKAKSGVFSTFYGGGYKHLSKILGLDVELVQEGMERFKKTYPGIGTSLDSYKSDYSPLSQTDGGPISFGGCIPYIESLYGFKRHFVLELSLIKQLFDVASKVGLDLYDKQAPYVIRNENKGLQSASGAASSAVYAAAFRIQSDMQKQAGNHKIQSTGAGATKELQVAIWNMQPSGVSDWVVRPMQVHDEIMCVTKSKYRDELEETVAGTIKKISEKIPLVSMKWATNMGSWAEK